MLTQFIDVGIRVTRATSQYQLGGRVKLFVCLDQQMAILLGRKSAEKQNVIVWFEAPLRNL